MMTWFHLGVLSLLEHHSLVRLFLVRDQELDGMLRISPAADKEI